MSFHSKSAGPGITAARTIDSGTFRDAMSRMASAVAVVTTDGPAGRAGFTATALASVSDDPPTLLICLNRASRSHAPLEANGVFCVNLLAEAMAPLAESFAGHNVAAPDDTVEWRFAQGVWSTLSTGSPVLEGALAAFDCRIAQILPVSTHDVVIGEVEAVRTNGDAAALVYADRGFRGVKRLI